MTAFPYVVHSDQDFEDTPARGLETQRLTLIARHTTKGYFHQSESMRVVSVGAVAPVLRASLEGVLPIEVERVILDSRESVKDFLDLLVSLPEEFRGDVLLMSDAGGAYLSSVVGGSGRLMHFLRADDVHFYLMTVGLANDPHRHDHDSN